MSLLPQLCSDIILSGVTMNGGTAVVVEDK